nr:uncharacterized protein LOC119178357 [Rhipicephalus microplus]
MERRFLRCQVIILLFVIQYEVLVSAEACDLKKARQCYGNIVDNLHNALEQRSSNGSALKDLCKANDTVHPCEEDLVSCVDSDAALLARQTQYTRTLEEACTTTGFGNSETDEEDTTNDEENTESKCWYKQLRRCLQRQISKIQAKMSKMIARNETLKPRIYDAICRKTRKSCHQVSTVDACPQVLQDAISKMEDSMNSAQALLCRDNKTLLRNVLESYKFWNVTKFTRCATNIKVVHLADYLFATKRLLTECKKLKTKMVHCLRESYSSIPEAQTKPDVAGATKVLEAFLERMQCVGARSLSGAVNSDENNNPLTDNSEDPEGHPDAGGTKTSGFVKLTESGKLKGGAVFLDIQGLAVVVLLSINIIYVLLLL